MSSAWRRVGTRHSSPWTLHVGIPPPADTRRALAQPRPGELPPPLPTGPLLPHHLGGVHQQLVCFDGTPPRLGFAAPVKESFLAGLPTRPPPDAC